MPKHPPLKSLPISNISLLHEQKVLTQRFKLLSLESMYSLYAFIHVPIEPVDPKTTILIDLLSAFLFLNPRIPRRSVVGDETDEKTSFAFLKETPTLPWVGRMSLINPVNCIPKRVFLHFKEKSL